MWQVVFCVNLSTFCKFFLQLGWGLTGVRSTLPEYIGGIDGVAATMEEARNKLAQRGERLAATQDKSERLESEASNFNDMAHQLANRKWWQ